MPSESSSTVMAPVRWNAALWGLVFLLSGNMLLDALEVSVVIVAMPSIGADLHLPPSGAQWMMSGFALGFGGLVLLGVRLVAVFGRRRCYLAALLVFAIASVVGGFADATAVLVATRFVKGFCAALTAPTGLAIIGTTFPEGARRNRAVSIYSLFGAGGFSAGLLLSGVLTMVDWRWTLLFPAPVALVLLVFAGRLIPHDRPGSARLDVAGAITFVAAAVLLVYAIVTVPAADWRTLVAFAAAAALFVIFVLVERAARAPLVDFGVFRRGSFVRSCLGAATLNGSYWGYLFVGTFQLQAVSHWSPLWAGLAFSPSSVMLLIAAPFSGRMVSRFGASRLIAAGAAAPPVGYLYLLSLPASPVYVRDVLPSVLLVGTGYVLGFAALHIQAVTGVAARAHKMVSGVYQTFVQIGGAIVLALVAAVFSTGQAGGRRALLVVTAVGVLGFLVALTGIRKRA